MRLLLLFCLCSLLVTPGQAQERVRNVRIRVADSSRLEIRYDLVNARPGDSIYLAVKSRVRGSLRVLPEFVRGDVGQRVVAGSDRRIVWSALANGYSLNEEIRATVLVKTGLPMAPESPRPAQPAAVTPPNTDRPAPGITEKPNPTNPEVVKPVQPTAPTNEPKIADTAPSGPPTGPPVPTVSQKAQYAGPAWALLSAVAPGFGNIFVQTPKPRIGFRPLLSVACYGLLTYGLQERQKSRDVYAVYEEQKRAEVAEPYYQTANGHYHRYYLATRGAVAIAAADVILTFFKGLRNVRTAAQNRPLSSVSLRPGLQAGQPTAVVRYSF